MLVDNSKDYHYYNKILNFVDLFPDCKKNRINEVNNDYFKNFIFDLMWIYKREMNKTNNSIMKNFYLYFQNSNKFLCIIKEKFLKLMF